MSDQTLLLVDDEQPILNALKRLLRKEPYGLITASSGEEGLNILDNLQVQVVVSDFRMPGMNGIHFLREVKQRYPNTVRCVLSGYADGHVIMDSINVGEVYRFFPKPWDDEELIATLSECFDHHRRVTGEEGPYAQMRAQNEELRQINELLERTVERRAQSLQLSQEILDKLPIPIFAVGHDGTIVLTNGAVKSLMPEGSPHPLGFPLSDVFPDRVVARVKECLSEGESGSLGSCSFNGEEYRIDLRILSEGSYVRGCTLVLDAVHHHESNYHIRTDSAA